MIFESNNKITPEMWTNLCDAIEQFPAGLITFDYHGGALATGVNIAHYHKSLMTLY